MKHQPSQSPTLTEDDGQSTADNSSLLNMLPSKAVQQQHMETSVDPYKHETSVDSVTLPQDNSNNNATQSDESAVSPYVAQVLANMPDVVKPPQDEELNKDNREEWEKTDKSSHLIDPEMVSFYSKITKYKEVVQDEAAHMFVPRQASAKESPNAKELGSKQIMATVPPVQRSPSYGAVQPSGMRTLLHIIIQFSNVKT